MAPYLLGVLQRTERRLTLGPQVLRIALHDSQPQQAPSDRVRDLTPHHLAEALRRFQFPLLPVPAGGQEIKARAAASTGLGVTLVDPPPCHASRCSLRFLCAAPCVCMSCNVFSSSAWWLKVEASWEPRRAEVAEGRFPAAPPPRSAAAAG